MPNFTYIPGVRSEVRDFGLRVQRPQQGPKLVVVGFTDNTEATPEDPTPIYRFEDVNTYDKQNGDPSELTFLIEEAMGAGARNLEVFVASDGSGNLYDGDSITPAQRYSMIQRAYDLLIHHDVDVILVGGAMVDMTGLASTQNFAWQMANFCYQATKEYNSCIGVAGVQPPTAAVGVSGVPSLAEQAAWVDALKAFNSSGLQGVDFSIYDGNTDSGGDGKPDNYAFWATTDETIPVGSPPMDAANVFLDSKKNPIDIGAYISVVASWGRFRNEAALRKYPTTRYYNANGMAAYAGLITTLVPEIATTNKVIGGVEPLRELSAQQVNDLNYARFVNFWSRPQGFVVSSGMTGAHNISEYFRSDFVRLTTMRITQDALEAIRLVANPFIGQPNNAQNRSALENAIDKALGKQVQRGALEDFGFTLTSTPTMRVLGQILVDLTLVPAFEIVDIQVKTGLSTAVAA